MIKVLYFARLKESLGAASEQIVLPESVSNLHDLRTLLIARGGVLTRPWVRLLDDVKTALIRLAADRAATHIT